MDILHEAPNLLQRYKHGSAFRRYVHNRVPLIAAALVVFLMVSTATTAAMVVFLGGTSEIRVLACLILAPAVLIGSFFVQIFIFFSWLEQRAMKRSGLPAVPWVLALVFLVAPFFVLALVSIKVAVTILLLAILTPVAYSLFDQ